MEQKSDEALMVEYQRGASSAFDLLYQRYSGRVFSYIKSKTAPENQRDLFQNVFLQLHSTRGRYHDDFPFEAWIFTLARNCVADFYRHQMALKRTPIEVEHDNETQRPQTPEIQWAALSPKSQQALKLRYQQDFSFEDMAKALSTSPSNARQLVSRALGVLRRAHEKK